MNQFFDGNFVSVVLRHLEESLNLNYAPGGYAGGPQAERLGIDPVTSRVDAYTIDGNIVSGTATFVTNESAAAFLRGEVDTVESVQGSFTVTCAGE